MLRSLVDDTASLVKLTGSFYDRYSDTHREISAAARGGAPLANAAGGFARNKIPGKFGYGYHREISFRNDYGTGSGSRVVGADVFEPRGANRNSAGSATNQPRSAENVGSNLDRAAEYNVGGAAGFVGTAVRELDRRCYSLLEANAQLCLKLQGLGLEYAGLTRELLNSGSKLVSV